MAVADNGPGDPEKLERAAQVFAEVRGRLFGIAYRMLGSATEAEDLVQEVWMRWQAYDRATVDNPAAFLATTITRLAINELQSARVRRETYVGPWLPEPVDTGADPYLGAERGEALSLAVLLLLERLSPTERAAYVLREAFDYPYPQIAEIVGLSSRSGAPARRPGPQTRARRAPRPRDPGRAAQAADGLRRRRPRRMTWPRWSSSSPRTWSATPTAAAPRAPAAFPWSARRGWRSTSGRSRRASGPGSR